MSNISNSPRFKASYKLATEIITAENETEYVIKARSGNLIARDLLFCKYLPLIHKVASSIRSKYNASVDEMVDSAFLGITTAIREYSPDEGSFGTYFMYHAYNKMRKCAYGSTLVKFPENHLKDLGRDGNTERVGIGSLDAKDEYGLTAMESLVGEGTDDVNLLAESNEFSEIIGNVMHTLTEKEVVVIKRLYLYENVPAKLRDIGAEIGVSHERVRQIKNSAIDRIKKKRSLMRQLEELQ